MEVLNNISEHFYREIRSIQIYPSSAITFTANMNGIFPLSESMLYSISIIPEDFKRNITRTKRNDNQFHKIDIGFPLLRMDKSSVDIYQRTFNRRSYAVVLQSNMDIIMLGNALEPLSIDIQDNRKDDGSGTDEYWMNITGETIIDPKII